MQVYRYQFQQWWCHWLQPSVFTRFLSLWIMFTIWFGRNPGAQLYLFQWKIRKWCQILEEFQCTTISEYLYTRDTMFSILENIDECYWTLSMKSCSLAFLVLFFSVRTPEEKTQCHSKKIGICQFIVHLCFLWMIKA